MRVEGSGVRGWDQWLRIKWIRTSKLSMQNSLSLGDRARRPRRTCLSCLSFLFQLGLNTGGRYIGYSSQFENNYFTEMCSSFKAGSYLRLIAFVYHSTLGLRVINKMRNIIRGGRGLLEPTSLETGKVRILDVGLSGLYCGLSR